MPFIHDGYSIEATIPAGIDSPAFDVTYRPMLYGERSRLSIGIAKANESGDAARMEEWESRLFAAIAKAIKSWTLKGPDGKALKATADAISRLDPSQFEALYTFTAGYSMPSKDDPDGDSEESADAKNS